MSELSSRTIWPDACTPARASRLFPSREAHMARLIALLTVLILGAAAPAMAITFTEDFSGALSPNLTTSASGGYTVNVGGGVLTISEPGGGSGARGGFLQTTFSALG